MNHIKVTPKRQKETGIDEFSSRSQSRVKEGKNKCPACQQMGYIVCYACCYDLACDGCHNPDHFLSCSRQFNKHTINVASSLEDNWHKHNRKNNKYAGKCKRCEVDSEILQYCQQCRAKMCSECSGKVHSKGKFVMHVRAVSQSPQKMKKIQTVRTQNCEVEMQVKREKKQICENQQYGFKPRERTSKMSSSMIAKKGMSVAKALHQNHQNTPFRHKRKNSIHQENAVCKRKSDKGQQIPEYSWLICSRHSKRRNILIDSFDLVCSQCYEDMKGVVIKVKSIQLDGWLGNDGEKQLALMTVSGIQKYLEMKGDELKIQFGRYREQLARQFKNKAELLEQKYKTNILSVQKWQKTYESTLNHLNKKCSSFMKTLELLQKSKQIPFDSRKQLQKVTKLQSLLCYQQIFKGKKDFCQQIDQYQFRMSLIGVNQFEQILKSFTFGRRRIDIEGHTSRNVNKMSQSTQLRQSRLSNSSIVTERKNIRRDDSMVKSSYYQLSHGVQLKRSRSKDIKQDLGKDISQRVLFPVNGAKNDKKEQNKIADSKTCNMRTKNSYFFDTPVQEQHKKSSDSETPSLGLRDVKYINLQSVITDKIDKSNTKGSKRQSLQLSMPAVIDNNLMYLGNVTQQLPDVRSKGCIMSDAKLIQSITIGQSSIPTTASEARITAPVSVNSSMTVKNKRKSDYMEMRDRLRKPSMMNKIGK